MHWRRRTQRTECERDFGNFPKPAPKKPTSKKKASALVALVGAGAAAALMVDVPKEESGRKVEVVEQADGTLVAKHVSGKQYLKAYQDVVGVWTICDGDTYDVKPGQVATEAECQERLERQLIAHAKPVLECVPGLSDPAREQQLVASVSLAYNIGTGYKAKDGTWRKGFCGSTAARRFNAGNWKGGCDAFLMWNKAGGRVIRGLQVRREREHARCVSTL